MDGRIRYLGYVNRWPKTWHFIREGRADELIALPESDIAPEYHLTQAERVKIVMENRRRGWYYDQRTGEWYKKQERTKR